MHAFIIHEVTTRDTHPPFILKSYKKICVPKFEKSRAKMYYTCLCISLAWKPLSCLSWSFGRAIRDVLLLKNIELHFWICGLVVASMRTNFSKIQCVLLYLYYRRQPAMCLLFGFTNIWLIFDYIETTTTTGNSLK